MADQPTTSITDPPAPTVSDAPPRPSLGRPLLWVGAGVLVLALAAIGFVLVKGGDDPVGGSDDPARTFTLSNAVGKDVITLAPDTQLNLDNFAFNTIGGNSCSLIDGIDGIDGFGCTLIAAPDEQRVEIEGANVENGPPLLVLDGSIDTSVLPNCPDTAVTRTADQEAITSDPVLCVLVAGQTFVFFQTAAEPDGTISLAIFEVVDQ